MKFATYASALIALFLFGNLAIAQDAKPDAKPEEKKAEEKFDRGDEKAEKALKTAYTRIISAEAKGLERFKGDAKMIIDMSSTGLPVNVPPQVGKLLWKAGKAPHFEPEGEAKPGPGGMDTASMGRQAFAPFMAFVFGVEAWDSRFKEANFKFVEPPKDEKAAKDPKAKKKTYVLVKYKDTETAEETYIVEENKVTGMASERSLQGQKQMVQYTFEYEDKGKELKIKVVRLASKVTIPAGAMPGQEPDPKHPEGEKKEGEETPEGEEAPADEEGGIDTEVKLTEFATIGKAEICTKLEVTIEVKAAGFNLSIPARLEITNPKGNKDVSDDDLKPMDAKPADGKAEGEDEGF